MGWMRLDDHITHHVKFLRAGPSAAWLWVCCLAHCQRQLSDGFVPGEVLALLGCPTWKRDIRKLVEVNLLHEVDGGYRVHDYLDHNASRADVLTKRSQDAARKGHGIRTESERNPNGIRTDSEPSRARPLPSPPIPSDPEPRKNGNGPSAHGPLMGSHQKCSSHAAGFCIPHLLHESLVAKCRGMSEDDADKHVRAFYAAVDADPRWQSGPIGEADVFRFLQARWTEQHGGAGVRKPTLDEQSAAAWAELDRQAKS